MRVDRSPRRLFRRPERLSTRLFDRMVSRLKSSQHLTRAQAVARALGTIRGRMLGAIEAHRERRLGA